MKMLNLSTLATAAFLTTFLCAPLHLAQAGGEGFSFSGKETIDTKSYEAVDLGKFKANPWHISVSLRTGFDDNVNLSPFDERESWFLNGALGLTYNFGSPRTKMSLNAGVSGTWYFDDDDEDGDDDLDLDIDDDDEDFAFNTWVNFSITHKVTPRLVLGANMSVVYLSQPGFDTFNANLFAVDRRNQDYFHTVNKFSVGYAWTPRFSTVTSYTFGYINYNDEFLSEFEDRFEHTFGNEFRFLIAPTTTLVAEYRLGIIDYVEEDNRSSCSHYFLAGADHSFSPRFNVSVRGGLEVRSWDDNVFDDDVFDEDFDDTRVSPYFEGTLNYAIAQSTSLSWINRYGLEAPNVPDALARETYRTTLQLRHAFTARISAALNVAYQHDCYDDTFAIDGFTEDAFDIGVLLRYALNRNFNFDLGYQHTQVISDEAAFREYTRNQYWAGITFTW